MWYWHTVFFIFLDLKQMTAVCSLGNCLFFTFSIAMYGDNSYVDNASKLIAMMNVI